MRIVAVVLSSLLAITACAKKPAPKTAASAPMAPGAATPESEPAKQMRRDDADDSESSRPAADMPAEDGADPCEGGE